MTFMEIFACVIEQVVPRRQDSTILPAWVANHGAGFGGFRASHIINMGTNEL